MPQARTESRALSRTSDWAATQNNLANVLREQGECLNGAAGAATLSAALVFGEALRVRTETYDPLSRA